MERTTAVRYRTNSPTLSATDDDDPQMWASRGNFFISKDRRKATLAAKNKNKPWFLNPNPEMINRFFWLYVGGLALIHAVFCAGLCLLVSLIPNTPNEVTYTFVPIFIVAFLFSFGYVTGKLTLISRKL
jgi:glycerol uptake facilitator-like aquaporin